MSKFMQRYFRMRVYAAFMECQRREKSEHKILVQINLSRGTRGINYGWTLLRNYSAIKVSVKHSTLYILITSCIIDKVEVSPSIYFR